MKPQRRSERCAIVNRTISFNIEDPYQAALLERSRQFPNFSAAVKRWLAGEQVSSTTPTTLEVVTAPPTAELPTSNPTLEPQADFDPLTALF